MDQKDAKKELTGKKLTFFLESFSVYIIIYLALYFLMALVHSIVVIPPYVRLALMIVFLFVSGSLTERLMEDRSY